MPLYDTTVVAQMQHQGPEENENVDDDGGGGGSVDWPACENVLRALSEDVRPTWAVAAATVARDDERVAADVLLCLAERVAPLPTGPAANGRQADGRQTDGRQADGLQTDGQQADGQQTDGPLRLRPRWRSCAWPEDAAAAATVAAAGRAQTRFMAVRSAYADGKYYASDAPHASRTVEELSLWRRWPAAAAAATADLDLDVNLYTYTAGTVTYDRDTGACHLCGLWDPRRRVAVDCGRLTDRLPGRGTAVKMFSELRAPDRDGGAPVLVPHHFQVFRPPGRHRRVSPPTTSS